MSVFRDDRFRQLLAARGLSDEQFALSIGRSYGTVTKLKGGQIRPSINTYAAIVRVLGCPTDELLDTGTDDRPSELGGEGDAWVTSVVQRMRPMTTDQAQRVSAALFAVSARSETGARIAS